MILGKYSMGIGDRFARQGRAQLRALMQARADGVDITPVWNKSHREHTIVGTAPADVRAEADAAVAALGWDAPWRVDADHVALRNVDLFIDSSDFFTLDVADFIGADVDADDVAAFVDRHARFIGAVEIPGVDETFEVTREQARSVARKFLPAVRQAGRIHRRIEAAKGMGNFITEISMDESDEPQTPAEMLLVLAGVADEGIGARTIAPKFTGRFNKGVDYAGDVARFAKEFDEDLAVIAFAVKQLPLPGDLKLSVHSGSDKFSIYGPICEAIRETGAGVHLKTAGTTWLEELIGLAEAGGEGLAIAREVYAEALGRFDELCRPYQAVIDIDRDRLPAPEAVAQWSGEQYAAVLRHDQSCADYNPHFRQLLHVAYKVAAEMGERYLGALEEFEETIARNVTQNLYERHIRRIFPTP